MAQDKVNCAKNIFCHTVCIFPRQPETSTIKISLTVKFVPCNRTYFISIAFLPMSFYTITHTQITLELAFLITEILATLQSSRQQVHSKTPFTSSSFDRCLRQYSTTPRSSSLTAESSFPEI